MPATYGKRLLVLECDSAECPAADGGGAASLMLDEDDVPGGVRRWLVARAENIGWTFKGDLCLCPRCDRWAGGRPVEVTFGTGTTP